MSETAAMPMIMGVEEVMRELSISRPYAYRVIRMLNAEMEEKGYRTMKGKVNIRSFDYLCYRLWLPVELRRVTGGSRYGCRRCRS